MSNDEQSGLPHLDSEPSPDKPKAEKAKSEISKTVEKTDSTPAFPKDSDDVKFVPADTTESTGAGHTSLPTPESKQHPQHHDIDALSLVAVIMPFIGMSAPGIVVSLIARSKAKKEERSTTLASVGLVINTLFTLFFVLMIGFIVFLTVAFVQNETKDKDAIADIKTIQISLEEYYSTEGSYPEALDAEQLSISPNVLISPEGAASYEYRPIGCTAEQCSGFELSYDLLNSYGESDADYDLDGDGFYRVISEN